LQPWYPNPPHRTQVFITGGSLARVERTGEFWGPPETREFGEPLIDLEEDKAARAVVFGLLAGMEGK
jgi:hypothetical protein